MDLRVFKLSLSTFFCLTLLSSSYGNGSEIKVDIIEKTSYPYVLYTDVLNKAEKERAAIEKESILLRKKEFFAKEKANLDSIHGTKNESYQQQWNKGVFNTPDFDEMPAIPGPKTKYPEHRVIYPDSVISRRNVLDPLAIPNNLQLYPFTLSIPMEGASILGRKHMEFSLSHLYSKGVMKDQNANYLIDLDQWFLEQNFSVRFGITDRADVFIHMPLYHFKGRTRIRQNSVELIGLGKESRNFWGAPSVHTKILLNENKEIALKSLVSLWFQFPEGNQRSRGGSSTGDWALNFIFEKYFNSLRFDVNIGYIDAGDLKLLNNARLNQKAAYFAGLAISKNILPNLAIEAQLHTSRSALAYTGLATLEKWNSTLSYGCRGNYKLFDYAVALFAGPDDFPRLGASVDLGFRW